MASTTTTATFSFGTPVTSTTSSVFGTPVTTIATFGSVCGVPITATTTSAFGTPVTTIATFGSGFSFRTPAITTTSTTFETPVSSTAVTFGASTSEVATASSFKWAAVTTTASKILGISQSTAVSVCSETKQKLDSSVVLRGLNDRRRTVGLIHERRDEVTLEWAIPDFLSLDANGSFDSPVFRFLDLSFNLALSSSYRAVSLCILLNTESMAERKSINITVAVKQPGERMMYKWKETTEVTKSCYWCTEFFKRSDLIERKSEFLQSGTLTIACSMQRGKRDSFENKVKSLEMLSSDFKDLYLTKSQCDVTIHVKDVKFKAHKTVLAARSSVFASAFEHDMQEKNTGIINIDDCDPYSFGDFLHYLYTGEIGDISFKTAYGLYVTADKYNVKELKSSCTSYMLHNLASDNVCGVIVLADLHDEIGLMSSAEDYFRRNYSRIVPTAEWELLMKTNYRLANKVLKKVVSRDEDTKNEGIHKK